VGIGLQRTPNNTDLGSNLEPRLPTSVFAPRSTGFFYWTYMWEPRASPGMAGRLRARQSLPVASANGIEFVHDALLWVARRVGVDRGKFVWPG